MLGMQMLRVLLTYDVAKGKGPAYTAPLVKVQYMQMLRVLLTYAFCCVSQMLLWVLKF